ncbi:SubName: Full=Uncharacterized protein {ECO:0000313/EMBL:CCA73717.1} [Serendipita indica DSM 11827]|uniref:Uncharacterized protein n=1 Tax=Serendipita indica (strain DSM 11827) TaxID=1109443 RepID=G4TQX4_SERID|nr:SubName: Full=Uncharacterized protein {ECO:0000313/EMBL:CCA73717.1} [Serendipita indica DSM 11827]CCA73717.1 hypothetical protein PIIN_07672 [Serendipita indica DSM 11827]
MHFQHLFVLVLAYFTVGVIGAPVYGRPGGNELVARTIVGHRTPGEKQAHIVAHELSSESPSPALARRALVESPDLQARSVPDSFISRRDAALAQLDAVALSRRDTLSLGAALHRFIRRTMQAKREMEAAVAHMPSDEMRKLVPGMVPRIALPPVV